MREYLLMNVDPTFESGVLLDHLVRCFRSLTCQLFVWENLERHIIGVGKKNWTDSPLNSMSSELKYFENVSICLQ